MPGHNNVLWILTPQRNNGCTESSNIMKTHSCVQQFQTSFHPSKLKCLPTTQLHGQFKRSQSCNCISRQAPRKSTQHISGMNLVLRWQPLNLSKRTRQQTQQQQHADTSKMDGKNYWSMQSAISALQQTAAVDLWETQKAGMLHYVM